MSPLPSPSLLSKPRLTSPPVEVSYLFTFIHPIRPILTRSSPRSPSPPPQPPIILLVLIFLFVLRLHHILKLVLILDLLLNLDNDLGERCLGHSVGDVGLACVYDKKFVKKTISVILITNESVLNMNVFGKRILKNSPLPFFLFA